MVIKGLAGMPSPLCFRYESVTASVVEGDGCTAPIVARSELARPPRSTALTGLRARDRWDLATQSGLRYPATGCLALGTWWESERLIDVVMATHFGSNKHHGFSPSSRVDAFWNGRTDRNRQPSIRCARTVLACRRLVRDAGCTSCVSRTVHGARLPIAVASGFGKNQRWLSPPPEYPPFLSWTFPSLICERIRAEA